MFRPEILITSTHIAGESIGEGMCTLPIKESEHSGMFWLCKSILIAGTPTARVPSGARAEQKSLGKREMLRWE